MVSFTFTMIYIALFVTSTMASMSPATSPATSVNVPTPSPSSVFPSPWLQPVVEPPPSLVSPPYEASPSMSTALPPYDGLTPAPAPNSAILDKVNVGFFSSCFISISFIFILST